MKRRKLALKSNQGHIVQDFESQAKEFRLYYVANTCLRPWTLNDQSCAPENKLILQQKREIRESVDDHWEVISLS